MSNLPRVRSLTKKQQRFIHAYLQTHNPRLAVETAGYTRGRRDVFDLMHNPRILGEIERRRHTPNLEDFLESGQKVDENFIKAFAQEVFNRVRSRSISAAEAAALTRLLEIIERQDRQAKA